jgi:2-polyprenyl-6-methoxyphenol hydroxylase-like FAD-dependent oxidoreductase
MRKQVAGVRTISTQVLVVGAGPVGLTLAMDLSSRGVDVVVIEQRAAGEPPSVKCNHVASRSMEIFRRLGIASEIRKTGLPGDFRHDIAFRTTTTGRELARVRVPGWADRFTDLSGPDAGWPTPEPPHRINQIFLEPVLFRHAVEHFGIRILNRTRFDRFDQADTRVIGYAHDLETGEEVRIEAAFLVGCDGARSGVRRQLGIQFEGDAVVQRVQSTHIRAPQLLGMFKTEPSWGSLSLNPRRSGTVYAIDGRETWLIHNYLKPEEPDFDSVDRDWAIRTILGVDAEFEYEVISHEDWFGRRLIASRFRNDRVFICGDAAHIWVPYAGYGMNAGIADAANLAWMLAAVVSGWAGEDILDAHEAERHPITDQVSRFAMDHAHATARQRKAVPEEIEDDTPEGEAARRALGEATWNLNVQQYCAAGLNFGYYYDQSPVICYDGGAHPPYSMGAFTPSTVPGCRVPHVWLDDGVSLYDRIGDGFAVLRSEPIVDVKPFLHAFEQAGVACALVDLPEDARAVYDHALIVSRPDQHVGWRGNETPSDPAAVVAKLTAT